MSLPVLLLGAEALALASRLALSGYRPLRLLPGGALEDVAVAEATAEPGAAAEPGPAGAPSTAAGILAEGESVAPGESVTSDRTASREGPDSLPPVAVVLAPDQEARIPAVRGRWGAVPILLGLADDSVEGRSRTLLSGADDFWLTGLGPSDLLTRLRLHRQLPAAAQPGPERLQVADLQVLPATRQVSRGARSLALTAREYQLLLLLLQHRGRVVSREEILRQVWQDQQGGASNVIEVYVRYLRQKLEQGGERRLLHTVRGRGYCLSEGPPAALPD